MTNADPEFMFLRKLKDSNEANLVACAGLLWEFTSYSRS